MGSRPRILPHWSRSALRRKPSPCPFPTTASRSGAGTRPSRLVRVRLLSDHRRRVSRASSRKQGDIDMGELLDTVITAHGGLDRWNAVRSVDVTFNFSGGLLDLKSFPGHHRPTGSVDVKQPRVVLQRLGGDPDDRWIFSRDRVWIERRDGWSVEERSDPRAAFAGHVRETPWDRLHLTYFLGYAIWNYLTVPFLFARSEFNVRELDSHVQGRETWRVGKINKL